MLPSTNKIFLSPFKQNKRSFDRKRDDFIEIAVGFGSTLIPETHHTLLRKQLEECLKPIQIRNDLTKNSYRQFGCKRELNAISINPCSTFVVRIEPHHLLVNEYPKPPFEPAHFFELFTSRSELQKILWISGIWTFFSLSQSLYDYLVILTVDITPNAELFISNLLINAIATAFAGLLGGAIMVGYLQRWLRTMPYGVALLLTLMAFTLVIFFITVVSFFIRVIFSGGDLFQSDLAQFFLTHVQSLHFLKDYLFWQFIMMSTIMAFMINDKYGPGNLRSFLLGRYFRPVREERIFMFLDLRSSTYIAQVLGEQQYFYFIKDVIQDATPIILKYKGRIYQYVGDEITVSWRMHQGREKLNCIRCLMEVRRIFNHRSSYYTARYGVVPDFKAGMHYGHVMVGEIGVVKRDIAFSGEVVGTAARIQSKCNHYEVNLLISEDLKNILNWKDSYLETEYKGELSMKGKAADLPLYTINSLKPTKT